MDGNYCTCDRANCFANKKNLCMILTNNSFSGKRCPFFKTQEQLDAQQEECRLRLEHLRNGGVKHEISNS